MAGKNTAVFGIYSNYASVESAVDALKAAAFRNTDISVLFPENAGSKDFAHEKGTKAPEGAATGAGAGAVVGALVLWLSQVWVPSLRQARSWLRLRASEWVVQWEA